MGSKEHAAALIAAVLLVGCSAVPSGQTSPAASTPETPIATASQTALPSPTPMTGIPAAAGVATNGTVSGVIYLGFEACVGLTPGPASQYVPPPGPERDFVLTFPKGWTVLPAHPKNPRYGDHFQVRNSSGKVVAEDGDVLQVTGEIKALAATFCGFGWPLRVHAATRLAP
jgi:hypothetical protein